MLNTQKPKRKANASAAEEPDKKKRIVPNDGNSKPKRKLSGLSVARNAGVNKKGPNKLVGRKPNDKSKVPRSTTNGTRKSAEQGPKETLPKREKLTKKEIKAKKLETKLGRMQDTAQANYGVSTKMKRLWEDLRRVNLDETKRAELCRKVHELVKGKEPEFAFAHDTSRVFQTLFKYSPREIRTALYRALKPSIREMVVKKYSVRLVRSMLMHCHPSEKSEIVDGLIGQARKLISHKIAGPVIEALYSVHANKEQKSKFLQQFYGPSYLLLRSGDNVKKDRTLKELFADEPAKAAMMLNFMHESLEKIIEKTTGLNFQFVHKIIYEYLVNCSDTERKDMADSLQDHVPEIVHSREGSRSACYVMWNSSAKGRKVLLKGLKPYLEKLFVEQNGHILLFAIFDTVDDTKIVGSIVLSYLKANWSMILENLHGRRVVKYLLTPRNKHFAPALREFLEIGDSNPYSVKDKDKRHAELVNEVGDSLMSHVITSCQEMLSKDDLTIFLHLLNSHPLLEEKRSELQDAISSHLPSFISDERAQTVFKCVESMVYADKTGDISLKIFNNLAEDDLQSLLKMNWGCFFILHLKSKLPVKEAKNIKKLVKLSKDSLGKTDTVGAKRLLEACV